MSSIDKRNNKIRVFGRNKGAKHFQRADAFVVESPVLRQTMCRIIPCSIDLQVFIKVTS